MIWLCLVLFLTAQMTSETLTACRNSLWQSCRTGWPSAPEASPGLRSESGSWRGRWSHPCAVSAPPLWSLRPSHRRRRHPDRHAEIIGWPGYIVFAVLTAGFYIFFLKQDTDCPLHTNRNNSRINSILFALALKLVSNLLFVFKKEKEKLSKHSPAELKIAQRHLVSKWQKCSSH